MKQRVFIDVAALAEPRLSGIGHLILETIRALSESEEFLSMYELLLVVPKNGKDKVKNWKLKNVIYIEIPFRAVVLATLERFHLLPPMDLILGQGIYIFPNYKNWPLFKSKSITYIHDTVFIRFPEFVEQRNLHTLKTGVPRWIKRTDIIATISNFSKIEIKELLGVAEENIVVLYCGVNTKIFKQISDKQVDIFRKKHKLPPKYILYLGNIEPRKNIETLLEAYLELPKELKDKHALLLVGGDGWSNKRLLKKIKVAQDEGNNIIRPKEYITDEELPSLYSGASILVQPAFYEGFGLSPLQAMACKIPTIVANKASLPEVCGKATTYVEPKVASELIKAMQLLLSDQSLRNKHIQLGLKQVKKFSWQITAKKLVMTLNENISSKTEHQ